MVELTIDPIDCPNILTKVSHPECGAVVLFLGTTRGVTDGRETKSLEYECYPEMANQKLAELEEAARQRWPIKEAVLVHRMGQLEVGEASVAVAVSSPHRRDAFESGQWLIDQLKEVVPIWKKENWADGSMEWVHPGVNQENTSQG